ncbi:carbohydrate ABC transporter membrane protein 1, CUT1 family (TC 3.A.1.1.-) [Planococcus glaciei]|uniref:Sugar ABC transporter permease n=1 Tax=Planococcus glaciei TaxID=459472 RepID=A0A1G8C437_9BACL|nr:sugar ABC transporter permease [Planococcus glaciei]ETP69420.1 ABC transporter permease [Planococcus glaciei CHR43]QDY45946.1 sugar ABC transporter permease [Planococcus glaciei]QKX51210.1 sugar ABC transporter permease [Planococcus glaciei]SDH40114.1 carbohydrate ABC transporter membrane protein 1, CUT1 family (TC 3.A.1.1.-) [Planococcus glaciei]
MPNRNKLKWFLLFTVPLIFIFTIVVLIPFLVGIYYSFFEWDGIGANPKVFVGLDNFVELWGDNQFLRSMWLTTLFTVLSVITINVIGLAFALLVTSRIQTANAARTLLFMPYLIGGLILGYIWQFVFVDVFSFLGEVTGLDQVFFNWLVDPQFALYGLVFVFTWQMAGYIMIIYIAGIQAIPNDVVEAAKIDGASTWQRFTRITFPLLMPALTISLFLTLSSAFKIYDVNLSLTGGGPANATELFAMNIYQEIFGSSNYGFGQAKAIVFFLIVAAITLTQVYMTKKREVEM